MPEIADIYQAHAHAIYWSALSMLRDEHSAMDTMQSVFLRALEHEATLRCLAPGQVKSWLYTTTRNACVDAVRKSAREFTADDDILFDNPQELFTMPEDFVIDSETRLAVYTALKHLPDMYRQPMLLYYFAQMQQQEIADYLNINAATVRTRIRRAKAQLYKIMQEGGVLHGAS